MNRTSRLFASLSALGINPEMTTFAERKKVQKLVYLLDKVFGMGFHFSYSWYLHGPYSPEVTKIVFDVIEGRQIAGSSTEVLSSADLAKIDRLKSFLGKEMDSNDKLELLVSLHFLIERSRNQRLTQKDVIAFLKSKKPYFTDEEIAGAIDRLQILEDQ
jgi:uncharacterized protein YwgA